MDALLFMILDTEEQELIQYLEARAAEVRSNNRESYYETQFRDSVVFFTYEFDTRRAADQSKPYGFSNAKKLISIALGVVKGVQGIRVRFYDSSH